ncbi:MAG: hypothetical protein IJS02_05480 [Bacteroidales bacterium]|nr:hypothetical protein [Bacteroidales bacterium]
MIDIQTKIHDKFSIEFKVGLVLRKKLDINEFNVAMWLFFPNGLDINPSSYTKNDFYRDVKSNVRLMTPHFHLAGIAGGEAIPLKNLKNAARESREAFDFQCKLFAAIVKSALRNDTALIYKTEDEDTLKLAYTRFAENAKEILHGYESVRKLATSEIYEYCGEFICNKIEKLSFRVMEHIRKDGRYPELIELYTETVREVNEYQKKHGYATLSKKNPQGNSDYIYRHSVLKKIVESQLYLRAPKKRDGALVEQAYYSIAAGLAMLFATVVAWSFQRTFGNLTWPLFIALIISYMMKDRIKELMRFYFSHKMGSRYFDKKAKMILREQEIGWLKEAMDFVPKDKIPQNILEIAGEKPVFEGEKLLTDAKVLLYRKRIHIDSEKLDAGTFYESPGINDIMRLQVNNYLQKMDDPQTEASIINAKGEQEQLLCNRYYYINVVIQYEHFDQIDNLHFRIKLSKDGISELVEV